MFGISFIHHYKKDSLYFGFNVSFPLHVTLYHHKKLIKSVIRVFTWRKNYDEDFYNKEDDDYDDDDDVDVGGVNIKGQTGRCCLLQRIGET